MENFLAGDLAIEARRDEDGPLVLTWRGQSHDRDPGQLLRPYFDLAVLEAEKTGRRIEMHFQHLDYFNSSTITALVRFIRTLMASRINLVVQFDARVRSQRLSFEALRPLETQSPEITMKDISAPDAE